MSLAEIPANNVRNNSQLVQTPVAPKHGKLQLGLHNGDENPQFSSKPSPIQGMLKNTTEIGDVGQFSVKPPRVPGLTPQLSPAPSGKTRRTPSKRRHLQPYYNSHGGYDVPNNPESPRQGSIASGSSSFPAQRNGGPHLRPSIEDYRSYSMTQNSYNNHSLAQRQFYANGQYQSRGDAGNARPRSPYAYPTRLKRPGHRPSSPALSELNRAMTGYPQGLTREPSARTTSPFSAYNVNRTPSPFRYVVIRSGPDLQHYPPYLGTEPKRPRTPSITSTRLSTPKPSPSVTSISSSSHVYRGKSITRGHRLRPVSPPVSPVFYDYTEGLEDNGNRQSSSLPGTIFAEQPTLAVESSTYSNLDESLNSTGIAELPSESSRQNTVAQAKELDPNQTTRRIISFRDNFTSTAPQDLSDVPELPENEVAATGLDVPPGYDQHRWAESRSDLPADELIDAQPAVADQQVLSARDDHWVHAPSRNTAEATSLMIPRVSGQKSVSPTKSMSSVKRSDPPNPPYLTPELRQDLRTSDADPLMPDKTAVNAEQRVFVNRLENVHPSEPLREPSFEGHSKVSTEILSPTPERSIASPSSRDRFSKILSIDEVTLDEEPLITSPKSTELAGTPIQGFHKIGPWDTTGALGPFRRKRSLYTRNNPLKRDIAGDVLVEKSDSEEEPELTAGFRQTFCKDDKIISQLRRMSWTSTSQPRLSMQERQELMDKDRALVGEDSPAIQPTSSQGPTTEASDDKGQPENLPFRASVAMEPRQTPGIDMVSRRLPRKQPSFRSFSPPIKASESNLPLDFTSLIRRPSEDGLTAGVELVPSSTSEQATATSEDDGPQVKGPSPEVRSNRSSVASRSGSLGSGPTSRPWNHDSSYPWDAELPALEVSMPLGIHDSLRPVEKPPRFKLKVQRASSSTGTTNKLKKEPLPLESFRSPLASSFDFGQGPAFRRKKDPSLSVLPGQLNSSHDVLNSCRQRTRFVDTFEGHSPTVSMLLASPNHEARSFFSDDSSQIRPKGALRKRLSDFKARAAAVRAASMDEARGYDRGLLSSALGRSRASGRSSRQSQHTAGASTRTSIARRLRWKMMDKIRLWLHRGEDKVRDWGWKMRYRNGKNRAASVPPYAGV